jgi:SAM-dependent methyltransferase
MLDLLPGKAALHYGLQRHVTRTLPRPPRVHQGISRQAAEFAGLLATLLQKPLEACSLLEFGAGRDLAMALALRAQGVGRIVAVDVLPLVREELVHIAAARLNPRASARSIEDLRASGIEYRAPVDMRACGLPGGSFDCVLSAHVLEHVAAADLPALLAEVRRVLRKDGVALLFIDYSDHYARADQRLSRFNFLKYSEQEWQRYNSSFQYVSRLRHSDYVRALGEAGFSIAVERPHAGVPDAEIVRQLAVRFRQYPLDDLFVQYALIAARPS